jgi:formyl-CoA transferase
VASREEHARALVGVLDRVFASRDLAEWRRRLDGAGLVFGIVAEAQDIRDDEQVLAAGCLVPFADTDLLTIDSPFAIRGQDKVPPRRAPAVGEHSEEVLRSAGYAEGEIAALREAGVIG